jgi:hypothetical protein
MPAQAGSLLATDFSGFLPSQSLLLRRQGNDGILLKKPRALKYFDIGFFNSIGVEFKPSVRGRRSGPAETGTV